MAAKANRCNKKVSIAISALQLYPNNSTKWLPAAHELSSSDVHSPEKFTTNCVCYYVLLSLQT